MDTGKILPYGLKMLDLLYERIIRWGLGTERRWTIKAQIERGTLERPDLRFTIMTLKVRKR